MPGVFGKVDVQSGNSLVDNTALGIANTAANTANSVANVAIRGLAAVGEALDPYTNDINAIVMGVPEAGPAIAMGVKGTVSGLVALGKVSHAAVEAGAARDALAGSLAALKGKAPATVTAGYNVKTGEIAAKACGGGKCAEDHVVEALGGNKDNVRFTQAVRPRTGNEVPVCTRCEAQYGRDAFPPGTKFKSDEIPQ